MSIPEYLARPQNQNFDLNFGNKTFQIPQYIGLPNMPTFGSGGSSNIDWTSVPAAQQMQARYGSMMDNIQVPTLNSGVNQGGWGDWFKGINQPSEGGLFMTLDKNGNAVPTTLGSAFTIGKDLFGAWGAMQNRKLARKQFNFAVDSFNKQYDAQKRLTNASLRDRQMRREAEGTARQSTDEYMKQNGVQ